MKVINEKIKYENIVNKSKFICILEYIDNINELDNILDNIKKEYKGANHYCYSYIIGNNTKYYDDGEPKGSAGLPIYNAIKNYEIGNVICVVVRYFGGIKLGLGPLTRAYFNTANTCLKLASISDYIEMKKISITFPYDIINDMDYISKEYIKDKVFNDDITYSLFVPTNEYNELKNKLAKYKIKIDE